MVSRGGRAARLERKAQRDLRVSLHEHGHALKGGQADAMLLMGGRLPCWM